MDWIYKLQANSELILIVADQLKHLTNSYYIENYEHYSELTVKKLKHDKASLPLLEIQRTLYRYNLTPYGYPFILQNNSEKYPFGMYAIVCMYTSWGSTFLQVQDFDLDNIPIMDWEEQRKLWFTAKLLELTE